MLNPGLVEELIAFFEKQKISYALFGSGGVYEVNDYEPGDQAMLFMDYEGKELSPVGEYGKQFWSQYPDE